MKPIRLTLLAAALIAVLAACGASAAGNPSVDPATADLTVTSVGMAFDTETLNLDAGDDLSIALVNEDSMPHNIAIYTDESASESIFVGDTVTDGTIVYDVGALQAGEYSFRCDLHPDMTGTLIVEG